MVKKSTRNILIGAGIIGALALFSGGSSQEEVQGIPSSPSFFGFLRPSSGGQTQPFLSPSTEIISTSTEPTSGAFDFSSLFSEPDSTISKSTSLRRVEFRNPQGGLIAIQDPITQTSRLATNQEKIQDVFKLPSNLNPEQQEISDKLFAGL